MDEIIKENIKDIKNGNYAEKNINKSKAYKKGAITGLFIGILGSIYFKKNIFLGGLIGFVAGGYIGYKISENLEIKHEFKKI
jgi:uncharacterized protein YqgC (DUF456 family)